MPTEVAPRVQDAHDVHFIVGAHKEDHMRPDIVPAIAGADFIARATERWLGSQGLERFNKLAIILVGLRGAPTLRV